MTDASELKIKIFADSADVAEMTVLYGNSSIKGFTTNPTLMHKSGVRDYKAFATDVVAAIPDRPISFEVFSDNFDDMEREARTISDWGDNLYVKIPITNTAGESAVPLLRRLGAQGVKLNVTAAFTADQVDHAVAALSETPSGFISLFAGRIADSGRDPCPVVNDALRIMEPHPHLELIWASPREIFNVVQANAIGCHVITLTGDLLRKLPLLGKDLKTFSLETVKMFHNDARSAGYRL
jgi:transaldolase